MSDLETIETISIQPDENLFNKKITPTPAPAEEIGIDLNNTVLQNIVDTIETSQFDVNSLNSFTQVSRNRNEIYNAIDYMVQDATLASVIETYSEDVTDSNDNGDIVWVESDDPNAGKFVNYLLNALNVNKNVYKWAHCLCTYGDVYLRLYRESEYDDILFDKKDRELKKGRKSLNEDVVIKAYGKNDNYIHYLEMAPNPAQLFELTRFGKTAAYVKTDVVATQQNGNATTGNFGTSNTFLNKYQFNKNDVELYQPTEWVHGCLDNSNSRVTEEVELFISEDKTLSYAVKSGESLLMDIYKVWRQLMLLENSVLLNRVTQSSIVRVIGVEVGDMPKESVSPHLMNIKHLIEQKAALDVGSSMNEYNNPGPIVNNIYIPTRNNQGNISTQQIGGDVNIGELVDLDWYNRRMFSGLRVPQQYFGFTDDAAGFSGGESLSIISSRYAKMIKRIQNVLIQMITDAINLILIDTDNEEYINQFTIRMQAPTTREEIDRRDNLSNKVGLIRDIMDTLADIENVTTKLKILKSLLSNTITDTEVINLLQTEIDALETELEAEEEIISEEEDLNASEDSFDSDLDSLFPEDEPMNLSSPASSTSDFLEPSLDSEMEDDTLPSPADLGIGDVSDSTNPELET